MTILKLNLFPIISKVIVACVVLHYIAFDRKKQWLMLMLALLVIKMTWKESLFNSEMITLASSSLTTTLRAIKLHLIF